MSWLSGIPILSDLIELGSTYIKGKQKRQQTKIEAETQAMLNAAENLADWEKLQAKAAETSWKDEYLTVILSAPFLASFFPDAVPYVEAGFEAMTATPEWYQWSFMAAICASFGIKGLRGVLGKRAE